MDSAQLSGNINYENDIQPPGQDPSGSPLQAIKTAMSMNLGVFKEPRGVMRIIQFIFSICAFATTTGFTSFVEFQTTCTAANGTSGDVHFDYSYPFRLDHVEAPLPCSTDHGRVYLIGDFSSDAQFFVATGVLSFLYCIGIAVVYLMFDAMYQSNELLPLADFIMTVTLAVFWLSGSAAWANGLTGLKATVASITKSKQCTAAAIKCDHLRFGSFSGLNISIILGFLNFFLWASDLWFLYKETPWFKLKQGSSGPGTLA